MAALSPDGLFGAPLFVQRLAYPTYYMGWPNFQPSDIYKPYLNVKFGTYYLKAALDMFDGNAYPALVGYNAGPGNARFWLEEANTSDDDLYVEEISLAEPKLYVRRVLAHYANYVRLYREP